MQIYATFPIKWVRILDYYWSQNDFINMWKCMQISTTFPIKWDRILDYYWSQNDFIKHVKVHADFYYLSYQMSPDSRLLLIPKWFYKTCESAWKYLSYQMHADLCYLSYQMRPDSRLLLIPKWFYKTCESACRFMLPFLSNESGFSIITYPKMIL